MNSDSARKRVLQCEGKQRFAGFALAAKVAKRKPGRRAYACQFCGGFHVGNHQERGR